METELKEIYWDKSVKEAVWKKGRINPDHSPSVLRWDIHGRIMMWSKFGRTDSKFGWTIGLKDPLVEGGVEDFDNLYPFNMRYMDNDI
ncbi:MAG: hypothetical protein KAT15_08800 [Bacteroidales bacterium]|nr:hypothetical protein [Bacteroidales bacterium]